MNISNDDGPVVVFRDSWASALDEADAPPTGSDSAWADYCRAREQAERVAVECASSPAARRIHQELAQAYAALLRIDIGSLGDDTNRAPLAERPDQSVRSSD